MSNYVTSASARYPPAETSKAALRVPPESLANTALWLTLASSSIVFFEPAPFDISMITAIGLLSVIGSARINRRLLPLVLIWVLLSVAGLFATAQSVIPLKSTEHTLVSMYLGFVAIVIAAFVVFDPVRRLRLLMSGYVFAALLAATLGLVGYLNILPGTYEHFTKFGRVSGTFKDPNVFAAFLIPAILHQIDRLVSRPLRHALLPLISLAILGAAIFLAFSRGAWICLIAALMLYAFLTVVRLQRKVVNFRLLVVGCLGLIAAFGLLLIASYSKSTGELMRERSSLIQSYDIDRMAGQVAAMDHVLQNPAGLGARVFYKKELHEVDVHNVYLSMFLNAGWLGGVVFALLVLGTLYFALRALFARPGWQSQFIAVYAGFFAVALEGLIIDSDHWRHFYILLGLMWGLMASPNYPGTSKPELIRKLE